MFAGVVLTYRNRDDEHNRPACTVSLSTSLARRSSCTKGWAALRPEGAASAEDFLHTLFGRHVRGSPFAPPAPCEFSLKPAGGVQEWAVLTSSTTFATYIAEEVQGARPARGGLLAAIQARK